MGLAQSKAFRGSAAFFAMLLAAASSPSADGQAAENAPSDQTQFAASQTLADEASSADGVSKFTRRRMPLAGRLPQAILRG